MLPDEVRMLANEKAILLIRGEKPVIDYKYDILKPPNVKYTADGQGKIYEHGIVNKATGTISLLKLEDLEKLKNTKTIDKKNVDEARAYFSRCGTELSNNFTKLDSKFTELDINERLRILYDFYRVGEEDLYKFDIKECMRKGHSFKDYICPDTFEFKADYFKMGERYARVLY